MGNEKWEVKRVIDFKFGIEWLYNSRILTEIMSRAASLFSCSFVASE